MRRGYLKPKIKWAIKFGVVMAILATISKIIVGAVV